MNLTLAARVAERLRLLGSRLRAAGIRSTGVKIAGDCRVGAGVDVALSAAVERRGSISIAKATVLSPGVIIHPYGGSVTIGRHVFLGPYVVIYGHGGVEIGDDTLIAMHCRIVSSNHSVPPPGTTIRSQGDIPLPTRIGKDVWLGAGVTVLGGVTIGDGCVVGAGAVVARDLPPYSIALGVPAAVVRTRG